MAVAIRPVKLDIGSGRRIAARMVGRNLLVIFRMDDQCRNGPHLKDPGRIEILQPAAGQAFDDAFEGALGLGERRRTFPKPLKSQVISLGAPIRTSFFAT